MADQDLKIILKLVDEASGKLKDALGDAGKETDKLGKKSKEANKITQDEFKKSISQIRQFRSHVALSVAAIYSIVKITQEYARHNKSARESLDGLELGFKQATYAAGGFLYKFAQILPVVKIAQAELNLIKSLIKPVESGDSGLEKLTQITKAEQAVRNLKQTQSDANILFMAGFAQIKVSQEDQRLMNEKIAESVVNSKEAYQSYYESIISNESNVQMVRQMSMQQIQQMAQLEMQSNNESFMSAQRQTQERINLLQFYQQTYNTAHQGMAAFTVMLGKTIQTNLSGAITDVIMNTESARDAFKGLRDAMIRAIVDFMVQMVVAFMLQKAMELTIVKTTTVAAAKIAMAWAPAATAASIATLGGAAAGGAAAYATALTAGMAMTAKASAASRSISVEGSMSGGGQVLDQSAGWGGAQADGGDYMVSRPTLFLAGEAGPERATFTPMSKSGASSGNTYIDINIDRPVVSKESDINALVEEISRRISLEVERIR